MSDVYRIELSDVAEMESESTFLWMLERSPDRAAAWYRGLMDTIGSLEEMPRRWPVVRGPISGRGEVRQLLYGNKRSA